MKYRNYSRLLIYTVITVWATTLMGAGETNIAPKGFYTPGSGAIGKSTAADTKAILDLVSTTKGLLIPRMTDVQRDAIASPTTGLLVYNTTSAKLNQYNGSAWSEVGSSGGGGGSLQWVEQDNSPTPAISNNMRVYEFGDELAQELWTVVRIPNSFVAGAPVSLKMGFYANGTSNAVSMLSLTTLVRAGTDAVTSTTNQRTSTNSAVTLSGSANKLNTISLDITSSTGQVNGVSVSAGDLLIVKLYRATGDSFNDSAYMPVYGAEVTFQ